MRFAAVVAWWGIVILALGLGAVAVCPAGTCATPPVDQVLLEVLHAWQQPWLTAFFGAATWLGSVMVLLPAALGFAWYFHSRGHARAALLLPLAVAGAWLLAHIGKLLVERPRPDLFEPLISMPADLSFPSAHAMQVAAFACALAYAPRTHRLHFAIAAAAGVMLVVALSRLYLQVHFPSDVLFGLIAGAAWALGLQRIVMVRP